MYLKVLTNPTHATAERTIILDGVGEVRYLACELSNSAFRQFSDGADQIWITGTEPEEGQKRMIGTLHVEQGRENKFILFDRVAFLCNNQGKAVERFLVP